MYDLAQIFTGMLNSLIHTNAIELGVHWGTLKNKIWTTP